MSLSCEVLAYFENMIYMHVFVFDDLDNENQFALSMLPGLEFHYLVPILGKTLFANCATCEMLQWLLRHLRY